ncbi:MAG: HAD family hydrolase [Candidatus Brocadiia bacterium]|nr:HAD family hydrolase [Candidatus Brocadiia bacterium]
MSRESAVHDVAGRGELNVTFDAVVFDLDGTLLDTIEDLADSMNAVLESLGCPAHGVDAYKRFVGDGVVELVRRALPAERRDDATVKHGEKALPEEYARRWADKTRPYEGVPELLDALTKRGVIMAVLSNKIDEFTRLCVGRLLPDWKFAAVVGAGPDVPLKPDPTGALEVARRLGVPPEGFLYLGDTDTDMQTAARAGMYAVGALWGFRTAEELEGAGARALAATPMDVYALLDGAAAGRTASC